MRRVDSAVELSAALLYSACCYYHIVRARESLSMFSTLSYGMIQHQRTWEWIDGVLHVSLVVLLWSWLFFLL